MDGIEPAGPPSPERTKIVFLAGTGRSGSTLLANAIGSLPRVVSAGEVKLMAGRGLAEGGFCGCRSPVAECPVWSAALESTFGGRPTATEVAELSSRLARLGRTRRGLRLAAGGGWPEAERAEAEAMADLLGRLLGHVAEAVGVDAVVDSSRLPAYGALLALSPRLDVRVVHLVRDPRAVAWSWQRASASQEVSAFAEEMEQFSAAKTALMWLTSSTLVPRLWPGEQRLTVRYEDFVTDPARTLRRVAGYAGLRADTSFIQPDGLHLRRSHAAAGNPNRVREGPVQVRLDDEWRVRLSRRDRVAVDALTLPRRRAYGY